jgi:hypothetical protein
MMRWIAAGLFVAATTAGGCQGFGEVRVPARPPSPVDRVDEIILQLTPPTAMNWDDVPGPDGLRAQVHFFRVDEDLAVTIKGTLELALYEGRLGQDPAVGQPFRVWKYQGDDLRSHLERSPVGWGYGMQLGWGRDCPKSGSITLLARYHSPQGQVKASRPLLVALEPK